MSTNNYEPTHPMRRLFRYLNQYRGDLYNASTFSVLNKIFDLMPPLMVGWIIDIVSYNPPKWINALVGTEDVWINACFVAALVIIIFGFESLFEWRFQLGFMRLAQKVQYKLRLSTYQKLQGRELAYFEDQRTGNLMAIINDDVNQLERFLNGSFNQIIQLITLFIFAGAALFIEAPWELALIGMIPIPFIFWGSAVYQRMIAPHYQNIREAVGQLGSRLENNISGIAVIKSFTAEKFEAQRVEEVSAHYRNVNFAAIKYNAVYIPLIRMFIAIGLAGGLLLGAYWILNGSDKLTVGQLTFYAMMIQRLLWPITRLGQVFDEFERARASTKRIFGLMDAPNALSDSKKPVTVPNIQGNVSFEDVSFGYLPTRQILNRLCLRVQAGETIGIAGTTGAGKTTLIKLLLRLYDVNSGAVKIDGINVKDFNKTDLRRNIALVSQDVYLFHGTVYENIAYGLEDASLEAVIKAAKQAELHDYIASLPNAYDSIVGERGIKLSGGQRQRLSIARAILKNAPILILDEATSAVDTETERAIQENLYRLTKGRTAFIIAHRLSTIRHADRICILNQGQVAEQGTHQELLAVDGIYADLWNVQIGESFGV